MTLCLYLRNDLGYFIAAVWMYVQDEKRRSKLQSGKAKIFDAYDHIARAASDAKFAYKIFKGIKWMGTQMRNGQRKLGQTEKPSDKGKY